MAPPPLINRPRAFNPHLNHLATPTDDDSTPVKRQKMAPYDYGNKQGTPARTGRFTRAQAARLSGFGSAAAGNDWSNQNSADPDLEFLFERPSRNIIHPHAKLNPEGLRDTAAFVTMERNKKVGRSEKERRSLAASQEEAMRQWAKGMGDRFTTLPQAPARVGEGPSGALPPHTYHPAFGTLYSGYPHTTNNSSSGSQLTPWQANYGTESEQLLGQYLSQIAEASQTEFTGVGSYTPPRTPEVMRSIYGDLQRLRKCLLKGQELPAKLSSFMDRLSSEDMAPEVVEEIRRVFSRPNDIDTLIEILSAKNFIGVLHAEAEERSSVSPYYVRAAAAFENRWGARFEDYLADQYFAEFEAGESAEDSETSVGSQAPFSPYRHDTPGGEFSPVDLTGEVDEFKSELLCVLEQRQGAIPRPDRFVKQEIVPAPIYEFHKFLFLPAELRERVYEFALRAPRAIRPHLCDAQTTSGAIHFHDDNQHHDRDHKNHGAITNLLAVTRVSKQIRDESFPIFYSTNTFEIGDDTATYFSRLEQLNRFHMIRHVRFGVEMRNERVAAELLEQMNKHIKAADAYDGARVGQEQTLASLKKHPEYIDGGWLSLFICLRKLASTFTGSTDYAQRLVIPVPRNTVLTTEYGTLTWFPKVAEGLGIHLQYLEGHQLAYCVKGMIGLEWHQQYQKKDFKGVAGGEKEMDVRERTLKLFPELDSMPKLGNGWYMRKDCSLNGYVWYQVHDYND